MFRENDIMILIGAGSSNDAGIPTAEGMTKKLEELLKTSGDWQKFKDLYNCVSSSIAYSYGIKGKRDETVDIEQLVNVLRELEKKENSILYPFIGSWNPRLLEIAGYDFRIIKEFERKIVDRLKNWVALDNYTDAEYYRKFFDLAFESNFSLRIFSLNYDICLDKNKPDEKSLEKGFEPSSRIWDPRRFEPRSEDQSAIYLYNLHGAINWKREKLQGSVLKEVDTIPDEPDLIFGTDYKLQYVDPYLFYAYELRKYSLESKVILAIGYSFRDEHINGILKQALANDESRKLLSVALNVNKEKIIQSLSCPNNGQVISVDRKAKDFLLDISLQKIQELTSS